MPMINSLRECAAYETLKTLKDQQISLTPQGIQAQQICAAGLLFSYAGYLLSPDMLQTLQDLANEQHVITQFKALLGGEHMNVSEDRAVRHHFTRTKNRGEYGQEQARFSRFATQCREGELVSGNENPFKYIVQVGIGGSHLGPQALFEGLRTWAIAQNIPVIEPYFLANIDPDEWTKILEKIEIEKTLFIVVSKSGSTQETEVNFKAIQTQLKAKGWSADQCKQNCIAVTLKNSQLDNSDYFRERFYIDEEIGGRFSATSAVGGVVLSLSIGPDPFESLLQGAYEMDKTVIEPDCKNNMALMAALLTIWERNILEVPAKAIIPYSQALTRFPAHLQQLECESNGKRVSRDNQELDYHTAPMIFGEPGTQCQHSFFQKIHQGTELIPIQFIGFLNPQAQADPEKSRLFLANLVAQMVALSTGRFSENPNQNFPGKRPCSLIFAPQLTPETLGALLAFYENKVVFESFLWNINAFDQEGVQLGKILAKDFIDKSGEHSQLLSSYETLLSQ